MIKGNKMGNTTNYDFKLCEEICELLYEHSNLSTVLKLDKKYPARSTFFLWKREHQELSDLYVNIQRDKGELFVEEIDQTIQDLKDGKLEPSAANVIIQSLKWKAAKYYPKMFGDKIDHTSGGDKIQSPPLAVVLPEGQTMEGVAKEIQDILKNNGSD